MTDVERIASIPVFAGLPDRELELIARAASPVEADAGHVIMAEGDFGHCMFIIESGTAEITRDGQVLASVGPGDVIGEIAVLTSGRRTASIVATTPLRLWSLFKRDVWKLEEQAPGAAKRLRDVLDERRQPAETRPEAG
jgi:CRP-like cAMP-binding protein